MRTVILLETLEHVEFPHKALEEVYRILKPGGTVAISSLMYAGIHDFPYDYWRFTPEAFKSLLGQFKKSVVQYAGEDTFPHAVVGIGYKGDPPSLDVLDKELADWQRRWTKKKAKWKTNVELFIPPILLGLDRRVMKLVRRRASGAS